MTLNRVKLGRAVTFMKYLASMVSLISAIKFTESFRAGVK